MSQGRVAQRYAEALLLTSIEEKMEEQVAADVEVLRQAVRDSRELSLLLRSPIVKQDVKKKALRAVFDGKVGPILLEFLTLIADKGREAILPQMIDRFVELRNERLGIISIDIAAATDITGEQATTLRQRFEAITRKTVRITFSIDKALGGGFRARVGDTVFDGTIKRQLERMRQQFLSGDGQN